MPTPLPWHRSRQVVGRFDSGVWFRRWRGVGFTHAATSERTDRAPRASLVPIGRARACLVRVARRRTSRHLRVTKPGGRLIISVHVVVVIRRAVLSSIVLTLVASLPVWPQNVATA